MQLGPRSRRAAMMAMAIVTGVPVLFGIAQGAVAPLLPKDRAAIRPVAESVIDLRLLDARGLALRAPAVALDPGGEVVLPPDGRVSARVTGPVVDGGAGTVSLQFAVGGRGRFGDRLMLAYDPARGTATLVRERCTANLAKTLCGVEPLDGAVHARGQETGGPSPGLRVEAEVRLPDGLVPAGL